MYIRVIKNSLKKELTYNWAIVFNIIASVLTIILLRSFWKAIYKVDHTQYIYMINYSTISMIFVPLLTIISPNEISNKIRNGGISIELIRPWNYLVNLFFIDIGVICAKIITAILPIILISKIFFSLYIPSMVCLVLTMVSLMLSFIILFLISNIISMICFWITEAWSLILLLNVAVQFFSGQFIPSWIMPKWLRSLMDVLPFIWIYQKPAQLYILGLNNYEYNYRIYYECYCNQFLWILVLLFVAWVMWKGALKRLSVQGG